MRRPLVVAGSALVALAIGVVVLIGVRAADDGPAAIVEGGGGDPTASQPIRVEPYAAPATAGPAVEDGAPLDLADLRGRTVIVNFWGSWCAPCRREFPELARFARERPDVAVLGVASEESAAESRAFMAEQGAGWPSISSPDGALPRAWRLLGYPETFVVDAQGRVVARITGPTDAAALAAAADMAVAR